MRHGSCAFDNCRSSTARARNKNKFGRPSEVKTVFLSIRPVFWPPRPSGLEFRIIFVVVAIYIISARFLRRINARGGGSPTGRQYRLTVSIKWNITRPGALFFSSFSITRYTHPLNALFLDFTMNSVATRRIATYFNERDPTGKVSLAQPNIKFNRSQEHANVYVADEIRIPTREHVRILRLCRVNSNNLGEPRRLMYH